MSNHFNPWHHVSPGLDLPHVVNAIIEIPKDSHAKYELDKESGLLRLDRVLYSSVHYPANYGFVPQTYCEDGDPIDILVLAQVDVYPMCIVPARVIGVMRMFDSGESDDKLIAVAAGDPSFDHINEVSGLGSHFATALQNFFEDYKKLENKTVSVEGFLGAAAAKAILEGSLALYQKEFAAR